MNNELFCDIVLYMLPISYKHYEYSHECNILNFGPNIYRHVPIDYDDYLDVLFLYWVRDPTAYEHDDLFYILGVSQLLMIYRCCLLLCWVWTMKHMIDVIVCVEQEALERMSTYLCVEQEAVELMKR